MEGKFVKGERFRTVFGDDRDDRRDYNALLSTEGGKAAIVVPRLVLSCLVLICLVLSSGKAAIVDMWDTDGPAYGCVVRYLFCVLSLCYVM